MNFRSELMLAASCLQSPCLGWKEGAISRAVVCCWWQAGCVGGLDGSPATVGALKGMHVAVFLQDFRKPWGLFYTGGLCVAVVFPDLNSPSSSSCSS